MSTRTSNAAKPLLGVLLVVAAVGAVNYWFPPPQLPCIALDQMIPANAPHAENCQGGVAKKPVKLELVR